MEHMIIVVLHQGSGNPHGPSWTLKWTLKLGLTGSFKRTFEHHGTRLWLLLYFTKVQGTLMDLHGPPNGP